jgi:hypothetical protein
LLDLAGCHYYKRCFICGEPLGQYKAFVLRPAAAVTGFASCRRRTRTVRSSKQRISLRVRTLVS